MAFLLNKTSIASHFRSHSQNTVDALSHTRRAYHIELGAREKALLAEDPALKRFKSHKKSVNAVKRMGDVLTLVVVTQCYLLMVYAIAQNFKGLFGSLEREERRGK